MGLILVTGGTGFLGSYLAHRLLKDGHALVFLSRRTPQQSAHARIKDMLSFFSQDDFEGKYSVVEGDITRKDFGLSPEDYSKFLALDVDEVWHIAGSIAFSEKKREDTFKTNVDGARHMIDYLSIKKPSMVHYTSTAFICGHRQGVILEGDLMSGQRFNNPYEESKAISEGMFTDWASRQDRTKLLVHRPSIVVGDSTNGRAACYSGYYTYMRTYHILNKRLSREPMHKDAEGRIILPIKVSGVYDAPLQVVTLDYCVDTMLALRNAGVAGTYHITATNPASYGFWLTEGARFLGLVGIECGRNGCDKSSVDNPIASIENQIVSGIKDYLPYFSSVQSFSQDSVKASLGQAYREHPPITVGLIESLLSYAVSQDFKPQTWAR